MLRGGKGYESCFESGILPVFHKISSRQVQMGKSFMETMMGLDHQDEGTEFCSIQAKSTVTATLPRTRATPWKKYALAVFSNNITDMTIMSPGNTGFLNLASRILVRSGSSTEWAPSFLFRSPISNAPL
jgi:hypothetical protein